MVPHVARYPSIAEARRDLQRMNKAFGSEFVEVSPPIAHPSKSFVRCVRNRDFVIQIFEEPPGNFGRVTRLSMNRTNIDRHGEWTDGITWDELQWLKTQVGYGGELAIEIYPEEEHVVNDANIRHLFVLHDIRPGFAWTAVNRAS